MFDERFFLYSEETDWEKRAHGLGWHPVVCSNIVATHVGGATSEDPSRRERLLYSAQEIYIASGTARAAGCYRLAVVAGAAVRAVVLPRPRRAGAARRLLIYLRGPCRVAAARH